MAILRVAMKAGEGLSGKENGKEDELKEYGGIRERLTTSIWGITDRPRNGSATIDLDFKPLGICNAPRQLVFCTHYSMTGG
jgi:hypothetical protein